MSARMKLSSVYSTLPTAERKVADFILSDPDKASHLVINQIAEKAGVSIPSVTRLARKLGYNSFMDFRVALANTGFGYAAEKFEPITPADTDEELIKKLMVGQIMAMESTLDSLNIANLAKTADLFCRSKRIVWFAVDSSALMASAFSEIVCRMGLDSVAVSPAAILSAYAGNLGEGDLAIAITRTGRTSRTLDALKIAKSRGANTVLFTNLANSPGEKYADCFISASRLDELYRVYGIESGTSILAVLEAVFTLVARKCGVNNKANFMDIVISK